MATVSTTDRGITPEERKVIFASSLGTVFEWYDFYPVSYTHLTLPTILLV
mgnify:CR=1 FL=1